MKRVHLGEVHTLEGLVDGLMRELLLAAVEDPVAKAKHPEIVSELVRILGDRYLLRPLDS